MVLVVAHDADAVGCALHSMFLLKKKLLAMRPKMLAALAQDHADVATDWETPSGSFRSVKKGTDRHKRRAQRASIAALAGRVREARYRTARLPLELIDHVLGEETGAAEKTVFDGMSAYEVELIVRCELGMEGNVDTSKQRRRFAPLVPTTQAVEHALWLFVQAIDEFCDDPTDIANVKIEYARFLQVFTADVNLATSALESAKKDMPSIEGEFEVFSRMRGLQQKRQSQSLGAERDLNLIALVEYGKRIATALDEHKASLLNQHRIFRFLKRTQHTLDSEDDAAAERLGVYIEAMTASARKANRLYTRLLLTHPSAPHLGAIYNRFALDVLNDTALASRYSDDDAGSAGGASAGAGSAGASTSGLSAGRISTDARHSGSATTSLRVFVPRTRARELSFLDTQFQCGTLLLLAIAITMFVTTRVVLSGTSADVSFLGTAGKMQTLAISAGYWARELSLVNTNSTATASMLSDMRELKGLVQLVHSEGSQQDGVVDRWDTPNVAVRLYAGNNSWYTRTLNLYDCANRLVAHLFWLGESTTLTTDYGDNPHWRFAMDNAAPVVLPAFEDLLHRLEDATDTHITLYGRVQAGLVAVLAVTLFVLGHFVFRRALARVSVIKRAVNEVALALQPDDIHMLEDRARLGMEFVEHAKTLVSTEDSDQDQVEAGGAKWSSPSPSQRPPPGLRMHTQSSSRDLSNNHGSPISAPALFSRRNWQHQPSGRSVHGGKGKHAATPPTGILKGARPRFSRPVAFVPAAVHDALEIERLRLRMSSSGVESTNDPSPPSGTSNNGRRVRTVTFAGIDDEDTPFSPPNAGSMSGDSIASARRDTGADTLSCPDKVAGAGAAAEVASSKAGRTGTVTFAFARANTGSMDCDSVSSSPCDSSSHGAQTRVAPSTATATDKVSSVKAALTSSSSDTSGTPVSSTSRSMTSDSMVYGSVSSLPGDSVAEDIQTAPQATSAATVLVSSAGVASSETSIDPADPRVGRNEESVPLITASGLVSRDSVSLSGGDRDVQEVHTSPRVMPSATTDVDESAREEATALVQAVTSPTSRRPPRPPIVRTTSDVSTGDAAARDAPVVKFPPFVTPASGAEDSPALAASSQFLMRSTSALASPVASATQPTLEGAGGDSPSHMSQFDSSENLLSYVDGVAKTTVGDNAEGESNELPAAAGEGDRTSRPSDDHNGLETVTRRADGVSVPVPDVENIFHAVPGALCCADATGTLVAVNDHFGRMLGYPASVSLGASLSLFVQPESLKLQQKLVRKLILTGSVEGVDAEVQDGRGQQIDVVCQSGATMPVLLNMTRLQHGSRFYVLLDIQDLRNHLSSNVDEDDDVRSVTWVRFA